MGSSQAANAVREVQRQVGKEGISKAQEEQKEVLSDSKILPQPKKSVQFSKYD